MKKLMIAAAIVCAATFAQAAQYTWSAADSYIYSCGDATYGSVAAGTTAYFAFVDSYSQADLVTDFANGAVNMGKFATGANNTVASGGYIDASSEFSAGYTSNQQAYFVIFEGNNMFISDEVTAGYLATGTSNVAFPNQEYTSDWEAFLGNAKDGYTQAGWYHVPEPTSGLLLLLGMAGLALRRRRA